MVETNKKRNSLYRGNLNTRNINAHINLRELAPYQSMTNMSKNSFRSPKDKSLMDSNSLRESSEFISGLTVSAVPLH